MESRNEISIPRRQIPAALDASFNQADCKTKNTDAPSQLLRAGTRP